MLSREQRQSYRLRRRESGMEPAVAELSPESMELAFLSMRDRVSTGLALQ
jgi:hypothetical protein